MNENRDMIVGLSSKSLRDDDNICYNWFGVVEVLPKPSATAKAVVPKLGAMTHGAIAGEPWAYIEKIYFSRIDTDKWTF